ncbi:hypothetical protein QBC38DRAFT_450473 [Podospora fimiseda]|uniref:Uncharacterized protein n=1 Tax=Podospora fimiseda TaxID=252190 RepID=A0AAN7BZE4_9PEZI|nr:hypothetical protein QBC38DRAFT_450473 [Podospora fimiseda]
MDHITNGAESFQSGATAMLASEDLDLFFVDIILREYTPGQEITSTIDPTAPRIGGAATLSAAIQAFALALLAGGTDPAGEDRAIAAMNTALRLLHLAIQPANLTAPVSLLAAAMCLLSAEECVPRSLYNWTPHLEGLGYIIGTLPAEAYAEDIAHRLFVEARSALIILGIQFRRSCFLAWREWRFVPFQNIAPSPFEALMSEVSAIPRILDKMHGPGPMTPQLARAMSTEVLIDFRSVLLQLDSWAAGFSSSSGPIPFWYTTVSPHSQGKCIWFESVATANALAHFWAFKVLCSPTYIPSQSSIQGYWRVIDYMMQHNIKFFGPTSVVFLLQVAYKTYRAGGERTSFEFEWCRQKVREIIFGGYKFLGLFIDEFRVFL